MFRETVVIAFFSVVCSAAPASEYTSVDIGTDRPGKTTEAENDIAIETITGEVWRRTDSCRFAYQAVEGDFEFVGHVARFEPSQEWSKAGLMLRQSTEPSSINFYIFTSSKHGVHLQVRDQDGGDTTTTFGDSDNGTWFKMVRHGDMVAGFSSTDGTNFKQVSNAKLALKDPVLVGFAATSNNRRLITCGFQDFTIKGPGAGGAKRSVAEKPRKAGDGANSVAAAVAERPRKESESEGGAKTAVAQRPRKNNDAPPVTPPEPREEEALIPAMSHAAEREKAKAYLPGVEALIKESEFAKALELSRRALSEDNTCPAGLLLMADCLNNLRRPKEALQVYQAAATQAKKEEDQATLRKATTSLERIGAGILRIHEADEKLIARLLPIAKDALENEQYEVAQTAFHTVLVIQPANQIAKDGLDKTEKALELRGDPVKAKIAEATLGELLYLVGIGKQSDARKMAGELVQRHGDTPAGREAAQLLERNFGPPKSEEIAVVRKQLKEQQAKAKTVAVTHQASASPVDVDVLERAATAEAKTLPKDKLAAVFAEAYAKGREFYTKATPGSEGNQKNVAGALEQFVRCDAVYLRMDEEKVLNDALEDQEKQASMLRYACMKMIILSH